MAEAATVESLTEELSATREQLETERQARIESEQRAETLESENETLKASLRAHKGQTTRARSEIQRLKTPRDEPARAAGPMKDDDDAEKRRARIWGALAEGDVKLVFSDGKRELRELGALSIGGDRFADRPGRGLVLDHEPVVEPGEMAKPSVAIAGFALFDAGDKQIAYSELPEPITVPRGGRVLIPANSIRF
jgi:hypothetical protein